MSFFTVDRLEGSVAVLEQEDGGFRQLPLALLPPDTAAGDVLREENGVWVRCPEETCRRRNAAWALEQKLRRKFNT